jgi:hypothetical protein
MENREIRLWAIRVSMLLAISLFSSCRVFAQDGPPSAEKGRWDFSVWAAGETGEENTNSFAESQIWSAGIFVGRVMTRELSTGWTRGGIEYAADFAPVFETYGNQRTHGIEFEPVILRWNSALHTPRISPYIELAGGAVTTPTNLPPGNTSSFNFTAKGGGGIYLWTQKRQALDLGCRWSHISNANLGVQNSEFNGVQFTVAYHWFK